MYNRTLNTTVKTFTPFTTDDDADKQVGVTITAEIQSKNMKIIDDIFSEIKYAEQIKELITTPNAIDKEISLMFSPKIDLTFTLKNIADTVPKIKNIWNADLKEVLIAPQLLNDCIVLLIKVKMPNLNADFMGCLAMLLHKEAQIELTTKQLDMFTHHEKKDDQPASNSKQLSQGNLPATNKKNKRSKKEK